MPARPDANSQDRQAPLVLTRRGFAGLRRVEARHKFLEAEIGDQHLTAGPISRLDWRCRRRNKNHSPFLFPFEARVLERGHEKINDILRLGYDLPDRSRLKSRKGRLDRVSHYRPLLEFFVENIPNSKKAVGPFARIVLKLIRIQANAYTIAIPAVSAPLTQGIVLFTEATDIYALGRRLP